VQELKQQGLMPQHTEVRSCAYLNNILEQDQSCKDQFKVHRLIKRAPSNVHDLWMAVPVA
jgi:hypothetical protein